MLGAFPGLAVHLGPLRALQSLRVLPYVKDAAIFDKVVTGLKALAIFKDMA